MATIKPQTAVNYGNGGADYNTAEAALKKQIAQNQLKIKTSPDYNQSEIQRTLEVIKNRESAGMDTAAQQKYLTTNLGYKAPTTTSQAAAQPSLASTAAKSNNAQSSELMDLMRQYVNKQPEAFSYDPNNDPSYQSALQRARANIDTGNSQAQAEMNRRGILNSTITSDRMGEIASNEMGRVEYEVVPQLQQQAYQQYLNRLNQDQQQFSNMGALAGMYQSEDQRGFDNNVTEAGLTGNYMPNGAKGIIDNILSLKQQAEAPGITAADRAKLSAQADGFRAQLLSMGVDPSAYGSNVNYNTARTGNLGIRTLQGQQLDMQRQSQDFTQNMQTRQQNTAESQWQTAFDYQKARDAITDNQWKLQFEQVANQFGLNYALNMLQENNQQAYRQASLALSQDDNARQWLAYEDSLNAAAPSAKYNGISANQIFDIVQKEFAVTDALGNTKLPTDSASKDAMYQRVMSSGLPDGQDTQILSLLGLTPKEIESFDKKYGVSSGN